MRHRMFKRPHDADMAGGAEEEKSVLHEHTKSDFRFSDTFLLMGLNISHLPRKKQCLVSALGLILFSLVYGFLQELISVHLCNRRLGLFLAMVQFAGHTLWSFILRTHEYGRQLPRQLPKLPFHTYIRLSCLRAVDLGMTNMALQYVSYPTLTLLKSSRVICTMLFGVLITRKHHKSLDYVIIVLTITGLAMFIHNDALFSHIGIFTLMIALMCAGAISNMSESIMNEYRMLPDEFNLGMYSITLVAIAVTATITGDLREGLLFISQPGTYNELSFPVEKRTWSVAAKVTVMMLFSTMGFFGSFFATCIAKRFGALTRSIISNARKATTLFLSCTMHDSGDVSLFLSALLYKSRNRGRSKSDSTKCNMLSSPLTDASNSNLFHSPNQGCALVATDLDLCNSPSRDRKQITALIRGDSDVELAVHSGNYTYV